MTLVNPSSSVSFATPHARPTERGTEMARVTHVKSAQQRYETKPVIDPATGQQKVTPVMRNGVQKTTKHGKAVVLRVTEADTSKPKKPYNCDHCQAPIELGTPYKHVTPKSGPYGGHKRTRHEGCPTWQVWDLSNSLSAQVARIAYEAQGAEFDSVSDVESILQTAAEQVREIAEQKREGAQNIEEGFGHETEQSTNLNDIGDQLDSWADDIEGAEVPEEPESEVDCDDCQGTGKAEGNNDDPDADDCNTCGGNGQVENKDGWDEWRDAVNDALSIIDECPV